jgi:hypothetical protein
MTAQQLINDIRNNVVTSLKFTASSDDDDDIIDSVRGVIDAIKSSGPTSSITSIEMSDEFLGCVRNDDRSELLRSLGCITTLQHVHLEEGLLLIRDIAELLLEDKTLKSLILKDLVLQGVESDFDAVELALHSHPSIKEFTMDGCRAAVEGIQLNKIELAGQKSSCAHGGAGGVINTSSEPNPASARSA